MRTSIKKRLAAAFAALALLSTVTVLTATQGTAAADGNQTNACFSPLTASTGGFSTVPVPWTAAVSPASITSGDTVDVTGLSVQYPVTSTLVGAGIGAGVLSHVPTLAQIGVAGADPLGQGTTDGVNAVINTTTATIAASNTVEGTATVTGAVSPTFFVVSPDGGTTIEIYIDPLGTWTGTADNGQLVLVPLIPIDIPLGPGGNPAAPVTFTSNGGDIVITESGGPLPANITGAPTIPERNAAPLQLLNSLGVSANFYCWPGQSTGTVDPVTGLPGSSFGFTPAAPSPIANVAVNIPPTAPVANDDAASVGAGQFVNIDVLANDTDANGNGTIDPSTVTIVSNGTAGTATVELDGSITYDNDIDTGATSDTFTYEVSDDGATPPALTSNVATVTVEILGDQCNASDPGPNCSLNQIVLVPILGADLILQQAGLGGPFGDFVIPMVDFASIAGPDGIPGTPDDTPGSAAPITLNGSPQLAVGQMYQMTVTNSRGTDAGWDLTGQVTDLVDGTNLGGTCPAADPSTWNNHCIPGDNLGWSPSAAVAHTQVLGDVADVNPGTAVYPPGFLLQPDPLTPTGLESTALTLCSTPDDGTSGGTFTCGAGLALSVPASAAAGTFTGTLTLTLA